MIPSFLLKLLGGKAAGEAVTAISKGIELLSTSEEMDAKLKATPVNGTVDVDIPDSIEPRFPTRGGKKFEVDRIVLRRVK